MAFAGQLAQQLMQLQQEKQQQGLQLQKQKANPALQLGQAPRPYPLRQFGRPAHKPGFGPQPNQGQFAPHTWRPPGFTFRPGGIIPQQGRRTIYGHGVPKQPPTGY